ncbi:MAG: DUF2961 domain-containing protein [Planctomycetes bacterium]|nr:DUF2961 domain-containing protein [Planctomycetota bacterium]
MRTSSILPAAFVLSCLAAASPAAAETPPIGFDALLGFDQLPLLADWPAYQDSSYHRADINQDAGNFLRVEANGDQVLVDTDGPGVVYRTWSTGVVGMQMSEACRLRFYFDGEPEPRLDLSMAELFGAKGSRWPFVPPLAETFESGVGGGEGPCNLCYVPIPFAKHLKVVGRNVMFYHVDYHVLPAGTPVESFSLALAERHRATLEEAAHRLEAIPARPGAEPRERRERLDFVLGPGEAAALGAGPGEGVIQSIGVKLAEPAPRVLRGVVLEVGFDDGSTRCVRVPVGDFFGTGCGDRRFASLPCGMTGDGYYSHWPMPFRSKAEVVLRNETPGEVKVSRFRIGFSLGPQPSNAGYFHARYVQDRDIPMRRDYRILEVAGRGKLVGANVTMQNARGAQGIFFLEGDEKIYVDGEKYPSRWLGTGTEDYFNGSYFWNAPDKARMARPHGGLTFLDWGIGRVCAYRWHLLDWIGFAKEIRVDLEHGGVSDWPGSYASVAYYYLEAPGAQPELPTLAERLPRTPLPPAPRFVCCELAGEPLLAGKKLERKAIPELDSEFESGDAVLVGRGRPGDRLEATLRVPGEDDFTVALYLSGGPGFGKVAASIDGVRLGELDARRPAFAPWIEAAFGPVRLAGGDHRLALELAGAGGGEAPAAAAPAGGAAELSVGLVAVQLRPRSRFIDSWSVIGNWPCPKDGGWAAAHEPEVSQDLTAVHVLPGGGEARWREHTGGHVGLSGGDWLVAYGLAYVHSPDARTVACFIGKDDALKIWLNGEVAFDQNTWSHATHDQFYCTLKLRPGWNKVLVKCGNWSGGWGFALRLGDPDGKLRFARRGE